MRETAKLRFKDGQTLCEIEQHTGVPGRTLRTWRQKYQWARAGKSPAERIEAEYNRLLCRPELSAQDMEKLKRLGALLEEIQGRPSFLAQELTELIGLYRSKAEPESLPLLNSLIETINKHTGAGIKRKRQVKKPKRNDFRGIL